MNERAAKPTRPSTIVDSERVGRTRRGATPSGVRSERITDGRYARGFGTGAKRRGYGTPARQDERKKA